MDEIGNEVFVIATNRRDGRLPDATKIVNREIFHNQSEAAGRLDEMSDHYGLYKAVLRMEARLDAESSPENHALSLHGLTTDEFLQLMWSMYNSGRADGRNGTDLTDGQVYAQIREDVADFLDNLSSEAHPRP